MATVTRKCECGRRLLQGRERKCVLCKNERRRTTSRLAHVKQSYGLTAEEYALLVQAADGACMCCHERRAKGYSWSVDHDHAVEREMGTRASIRGLVCRRCNRILRICGDSASLLRKVAAFLDKWPSAAALGRVAGFTEDRKAR